MPITIQNGTSHKWNGFVLASCPNTNSPGLSILSGFPLYADLQKFKQNVLRHEHKKTFHVKGVDQKLLASSNENRMPPTGAPKAAAT